MWTGRFLQDLIRGNRKGMKKNKLIASTFFQKCRKVLSPLEARPDFRQAVWREAKNLGAEPGKAVIDPAAALHLIPHRKMKIHRRHTDHPAFPVIHPRKNPFPLWNRRPHPLRTRRFP